MPSVKSLRAVLLFVILCGHLNTSISQETNLEGIYESVTESEWGIVLKLMENNAAEIILESWVPGSYEDRDIEITNALWFKKGKEVILEYGGISDTLVYDNNLTLSILGRQGGAPGFIQIKPFDPRSIIKDQYLWIKDYHLRSKDISPGQEEDKIQKD